MNNLSEMEAALVQSLAASQQQLEQQLNELQTRLARLTESYQNERTTNRQLREQVAKSESELQLVARERDQLQQALSSASDALAGDTLVALPCAEGGNKWFRPSAFQWFEITPPFPQTRETDNPVTKDTPRNLTRYIPGSVMLGELTPSRTIVLEETGVLLRTLKLDNEEICTVDVATMARIEAELHAALNPTKKQQQPSTKPGQ